MSEHFGFKRKWWITPWILCVLAATVVLAGQANIWTGSKSGNGATLPVRYDVISVKPSKHERMEEVSPDMLSVSTTASSMIFDAYGPLEYQQISGWPKWSDSALFDVQAKIDHDHVVALQKLSPKDQSRQRQLMLRALLADRFGLRVHHEFRTLPIYELVIAKGGCKMKASDAPETNVNGIGRLTAQGMPIADLVRLLDLFVHRVVVDKTGLSGRYDFDLRWTPDNLADLLKSGPPEYRWRLPKVSGPSIFTALQEQLGLRLNPTKGPVDVLVIDQLKRPSPN